MRSLANELNNSSNIRAPAKRAKPPKPEIVSPARRSVRPRKEVNYDENSREQVLKEKVTLKERKDLALDPEEVERLRKQYAEAEEIVTDTSKKPRAAVDSGKGVRIQGGKVYDSKHGVTCHWCRQKTLEDNVTCTHPGCGKGKRLPTTFCKNCLKNRHGEDCAQANKSNSWVCPGCRVSCGPGCVSCCNCGPCRKKLGLEPTHQVARLAKEAGFSNVHDYLVHLSTGESAKELASRKLKHAWGFWLQTSEFEVSGQRTQSTTLAEDHSEGLDGNAAVMELSPPCNAEHAVPANFAADAKKRVRLGKSLAAAKRKEVVLETLEPRNGDPSRKQGEADDDRDLTPKEPVAKSRKLRVLQRLGLC